MHKRYEKNQIKTFVYFGTPRGVYISVGEIPIRQLTVRSVVKGAIVPWEGINREV